MMSLFRGVPKQRRSYNERKKVFIVKGFMVLLTLQTLGLHHHYLHRFIFRILLFLKRLFEKFVFEIREQLILKT